MMSVFAFFQRLRVEVSSDQSYLEVDYNPSTPDALYDICDTSGRIIKTGKVEGRRLRVAINDLISSCYVLLILDGKDVRSKRFNVER
jgi:hypothetical protein